MKLSPFLSQLLRKINQSLTIWSTLWEAFSCAVRLLLLPLSACFAPHTVLTQHIINSQIRSHYVGRLPVWGGRNIIWSFFFFLCVPFCKLQKWCSSYCLESWCWLRSFLEKVWWEEGRCWVCHRIQWVSPCLQTGWQCHLCNLGMK